MRTNIRFLFENTQFMLFLITSLLSVKCSTAECHLPPLNDHIPYLLLDQFQVTSLLGPPQKIACKKINTENVTRKTLIHFGVNFSVNILIWISDTTPLLSKFDGKMFCISRSTNEF